MKLLAQDEKDLNAESPGNDKSCHAQSSSKYLRLALPLLRQQLLSLFPTAALGEIQKDILVGFVLRVRVGMIHCFLLYS
jgi:hypothetical protein